MSMEWNPADEMISLREAMSNLLEESVLPSQRARQGQRAESRSALRLPLDAYLTDEELVIKASLPGLGPDDVEITLEEDRLTIKGELSGHADDVEYLIHERPCSCSFSRTLRLNMPVDVEKAEASFEDGVLTLVLPKAEAARPKVIKIS